MYYVVNQEEAGSHEPFLGPDNKENILTEEIVGDVKRVSNRIQLSTVLIHAVVALTYFIVITATVSFRNNGVEYHPDERLYSPAQEAIEYEIRTFEALDENNPFAGDPRPEHDRAWSDILQNSHVRFSEKEMIRMNRTSIALKDGSGYVAQLSAYHELHCVKWIRKWIHREHYWPALKGALLLERKTHIDHCLEHMRLNAMCHGSRAVTTFEWYGSQPKPVAEEQYECVNWDKFNQWNADRRVEMYDLDAFKDRPEPQEWELIEHDVRLGITEGRPEQDGGLT